MSGFKFKNNLLSIEKDPNARLTYGLDWVNWLETGDSLDTVTFTVQARANDPKPLVMNASGITDTITWVDLSSGQLDKTYIVSAEIESTNGLVDRRNFRVNIVNRSG